MQGKKGVPEERRNIWTEEGMHVQAAMAYGMVAREKKNSPEMLKHNL